MKEMKGSFLLGSKAGGRNRKEGRQNSTMEGRKKKPKQGQKLGIFRKKRKEEKLRQHDRK